MNAQPFPAGGFAGPAHGTDALYEIGGFLRHVQGHPTQLVGGRDRSLVVGVIRLEPRCVIGGAGLVLGMLSVGVCGLSWCCVVFSVVQWNEGTRTRKKNVSSNELQGPCKHQKLRMDGTLTLNTRTAATHKQCKLHPARITSPRKLHQHTNINGTFNNTVLPARMDECGTTMNVCCGRVGR